ncbi:MAG: hypothetical protein KAY24_09235 [Candidatus Eisenbacteria sp.]|nr:hypothetical protein [Candidatus Eisenbacteria bacterium]
MKRREEHILEETLAALIDGQLGSEDEAKAREHLIVCRYCYAAYAEAVHHRTIELDDPNAFAPSPEMVTLGNAVPADRPAARDSQGRWGRESRWLPTLPRPVALGLPVAAVALLAAFLMILPPPHDPGDDPLAGNIRCIQQLVIQASARGMILPGGETVSGDQTPVYRSGAAAGNGEPSSAVNALAEAYEQGNLSRLLAFWLVSGQVAQGQLGSARAYAREARKRFPNDTRLTILEAVIAYRESDLPRAERLLRDVLDQDQSNAVALFNLGLLLSERGRRGEAAQLLRSAEQQAPKTSLGKRAAAALERL